MAKEWQELEDLVFKIYKELEPYADVRLNDHIDGLYSNSKRQIDISIRSRVAGHDMLLIIQAKK